MTMTSEEYEAASKLYEENQGLPIWVVNTHFPQLVGDDDVYQNARIGLWRACCSYSEDRTKFSTFATKCIHNEIVRPMRSEHSRAKYHMTEVSMSTVLATGDQQGINFTLEDLLADPVDRINGSDAPLWDFIAQLSKRDREIILLKYAGYSLREISKKLGCTIQACSKRLCNARNKYITLSR